MHIWLQCLVAFCALAVPASIHAQTDPGRPHLEKHGTATQLIVDGKPFLALSGELGNNTASSLESMEPIWPKLVSGNLNSVLAAISWAQLEPQEGKFEFALVDGLIEKARENNLHLVFLWFGSWKNGFSSYAPVWVKRDFTRFPRIQIQDSASDPAHRKTVELLSTFGDNTRDADAAAFGALMRHIREVDGTRHTVLMMQVENEVGVLRDTRDRSPVADRAYAGEVPRDLMAYLVKHKETLSPQLREVLVANGSRTSGTWEQVFGSGKPADLDLPLQTKSPPLSAEEYESGWRKLHWTSDETFMAWHYARYVEKIFKAGKAGYDIPMFANAWLQQPGGAWPGTYPSGGPLPQVQDVWRAGAPSADFFAPDLYLQYFDETCERFSLNGNPLFIPETNENASNALVAAGKYNAMGFSPFFIERAVGPDTELAASYRILAEMSPMILAHQGSDSMTAVRLNQGDQPKKVTLGGYTLEVSYVGRGRVPIAPESKRPSGSAATGAAGLAIPSALPSKSAPASSNPAAGPTPNTAMQAAAVLIAAGPDEFYMGGGGLRIAFTPTTPGPATVGLGDVQQGKFVDGKWVVIRQLGGDDTAQGEILTLRPNTILHVTVYRYP